MDKKNIKDYIKNITLVYIVLILLIFTPIQLIISVVKGIVDGNIIGNTWTSILFIIKIGFGFGVIIYGIAGVIYVFQILKRKSSIISSNEYVRELPETFPPAVASLLLDSSIETTTDYTATIAYLISKGFVKIDEETEKAIAIKDQIGLLTSHEQYAYNCILGRVKFNHEEFKRLVVSDAKNMGLITNEKRKIHFIRNFSISIVTFMVLSIVLEKVTNPILYSIIGGIGALSGISIFGVIGYSIYLSKKHITESYRRTRLGNVEALRWTGVKKYIKDYTLLSDRELKDIELFEDYIPYAISLNEAKSIEKYIENNEKYRSIIYKEK